MIDLLALQSSDFTGLVGAVFRVAEAPQAELRLGTVKVLGSRQSESLRDPFSLTFHGPSGLRMPQGIQRLECDVLGVLEVFMVQLADGSQGSEFEVIFT